MKKTVVFFLTAVLLFLLVACGGNQDTSKITEPDGFSVSTDSLDGDSSAEIPPDPEDDYTAFYEYLLGKQSLGEMPYEDKLIAEGEVVDEFSLMIGKKIFDNAVAADLTVYTAAFELFTKVEGHSNSWIGYRFTEVCDILGIELKESIKLYATDGFSQVFDVKNIDDNTMIAITKDGDPADGPYFAPCSYLISANYTKYLSEIDIL